MSALLHSMLGLPRSGKTTFLAALWHLIDAGEIETKLVLDKLVGDHEHLNTVVEAWRRCEEVPRTSIAGETSVSIHVRMPATGRKVVLEFPDLSGESFEAQVATRACTPGYVDSHAAAGGVLLFVNADRADDGIRLVDLVPAIGVAQEEPSITGERDWSPKLVPEQVRLVDLLQFLQRAPFVRRQRRLAVVISAWDAVLDPKPSPEEWLARSLPLLHQFINHNPDSFAARIYGVSAQGGDVSGGRRAELARKIPSRRILCVGPDTEPHDLTAPLLWLSEGD